jgi:hypothetical protein
VTSLSTLDPDGPGPQPPVLVAGGSFVSIGGVTALRIAQFDGVSWSPLGAGFNSTVWTLAHWNPGSGDQLVAGGDFSLSGTTAASGVAAFDGNAWHGFGAGTNNTVRAVAAWDSDGPGPNPQQIVVGGQFTMAGGSAIPRIAFWNGVSWQGFGAGVNGGVVYALASFDPDGSGPVYPQLAVGGDFTLAGGNIANRVATWVSAPTPVVITSPSSAVACAGTPASFSVRAAAGGFPTYQWRRNGTPLSNGPTGTGSTISGATSITLMIANPGDADLAQYDAVVTNACGSDTSAAATMTRCISNCDCSTVAPILNVGDFVCFQSRFAAGDSLANCDGSTTAPILNVGDFICFQGKFAAGCP